MYFVIEDAACTGALLHQNARMKYTEIYEHELANLNHP